MSDGWLYFRQRRWIWLITVAFAIMNAIQMGVWQVLGPIIAKHSFGSAGWGLTLGIKSVGMLIASLAMLRLPLEHPLRDGMMAISVSGLPLIILGQGYALPYLLIVAVIAGVGSSISGVSWDTTLQKAIPKDKLARVYAFDEFGSYITIPLGEVLAVPLAGIFGYQMVATIGGIIFILVALLPLLDLQVRKITSNSVPF